MTDHADQSKLLNVKPNSQIWTREPWGICCHVSGSGVATEIGTTSGQRIASVGDHHFRCGGDGLHYLQIYKDNGFSVADANAERIIETVNAMAGISNPQLAITKAREAVLRTEKWLLSYPEQLRTPNWKAQLNLINEAFDALNQ